MKIPAAHFRTVLPARLATRLLLGAAFVGAAVGAVGIALVLAISSLHRTAGQARHSERVIGQANLVERLVLDLETGERGYVITGQRRFLEPYRSARADLGPEARLLTRLVQDDPDQRLRAVAIERQTSAYLRDWVIPLVDTARQSLPRARAKVATGGGKRRVDAIRHRFRKLVTSEELDNRQRGASANAAAFRATAIAGGGFALALTLLAFFVWFLSRTVLAPIRRVAEAARAVGSGDLGARVPGGGPVELADLSGAFNRMARSIEHDQARLNEQNEQLREVDRLKDEFVAAVSHELRTPLTSIRGYLDLVLDGSAGELNERQRRYLGVADRNSRRLLSLVGDLLLFAQIRAGKFKLHREPVDAVEVARDAFTAVAPAADAKQIELVLDDGVRTPLTADRARLGQVLDNLLSNAVKFTPEGGIVTLRVKPEGDSVRLEVADTGMGIPADETEQLFARFFRSSNATEQAIPGTGLGLTIVKALVEAHGGRISVESVEGSGTTFRIDLPSHDSSEARA
ncbi:MAG TPA: ATP-binding protein [Gaiellaceae bacterium]|nr:ATP-binding protein [Gaiellaceae bacterium]